MSRLKGLSSGRPNALCSEAINTATHRGGAAAAAYEADDGPLSKEYLAALKKDADAHFPAGVVLFHEHLFHG